MATLIPASKQPHLSQYFHLYFMVISALFTACILRAQLSKLTAQTITIFRTYTNPLSTGIRKLTASTSHHWLPLSNTYHQIPDSNDPSVRHHDDYESIEMTDYNTSAQSTQSHRNDEPISPHETLSAHIASAFEAYPEGLDRISLIDTMPLMHDAYGTSDSSALSVCSGDSVFDLEMCNVQESRYNDVGMGNYDGVSAGMGGDGGLISSFEDGLAPLVDWIVDWIVRSVERKVK